MNWPALFALPCTALAWSASAQELVPLPDGFTPNCMSGDGRVVGGSYQSGRRVWAALWTRNGGVEVLQSSPSGSVEGAVCALTVDGSAGAGLAVAVRQVPMRWSRPEGVIYFTGIEPAGTASCYGISDDGRVIVGVGWLEDRRGFTWTAEDGLRNLPDDASGQASCVSGNGRYFGGGVGTFNSAELWRWSLHPYSGHALNDASPANGWATAMSRAGDVIVGQSHAHGFLWTTQGFQRVDAFERFMDVTDDGRTAVGQMLGHVAGYYTQGLGPVPLAGFLTTTFGMDLSDNNLTLAIAISYDGRTITGTGTPSNWVVYLPAPRPGDFNGDEEVTTDDLVSYLDCFMGESILPPTAADITRDDFTDWIDFDEFLSSF